MARDQTKSRFPPSGAGAIDERLLPKRRVDCSRVNELLDLVQRRFAPSAVEFGRLLLEQRVDVGIAAVHIGAALRHEGFEARGGVAEGGARALDDVFEALLPIALEEGCPFERPELGPDAHVLEVVEYRLC